MTDPLHSLQVDESDHRRHPRMKGGRRVPATAGHRSRKRVGVVRRSAVCHRVVASVGLVLIWGLAAALPGVSSFAAPARAEGLVTDATRHGVSVVLGQDRKVRWGACDPKRDDLDPLVKCGLFRLPISWDKPSGPSFDARVYFKGSDSQLPGTENLPFFIFPSGPGETADVGFATVSSLLPGATMVGLDPRGVGESGRLTCNTRRLIDLPTVMPLARDAFGAAVERSEAFARTCRTQPRALIDHLDAYSNARDAQALRMALGLSQVGIFGVSYGTILAERFLEVDGQAVSAGLLEGLMDPTLSPDRFQATAAMSLERLFDRFKQWCQTAATCQGSPRAAEPVFRSARAQAAAGRVPGVTALHKPWNGAAVTQFLEMSGVNGDFGPMFSGLVALSAGRRPATVHTAVGALPERIEVPDVIVCSDFDLGVSDWGERLHIARTSRKSAPIVKFSPNAASYMAICAGRPRPLPRALAPVTPRTSAPVMLLSCDIDALTPSLWASRVARQMGPSSVHLIAPCIGHGTALEVPAVRAQVMDYLRTRAEADGSVRAELQVAIERAASVGK